MKHSSWKDAHLQSIGLQEVRYTNVERAIKGIRNLSRKDIDYISSIDPFVLGKVVNGLSKRFPDMIERIDEGRKVSVTVDW